MCPRFLSGCVSLHMQTERQPCSDGLSGRACQLLIPVSLDGKTCLLQTASPLLTAAAGKLTCGPVWGTMTSPAVGPQRYFPRTLAQHTAPPPHTAGLTQHALRYYTDVSMLRGRPSHTLTWLLPAFTVSLCPSLALANLVMFT